MDNISCFSKILNVPKIFYVACYNSNSLLTIYLILYHSLTPSDWTLLAADHNKAKRKASLVDFLQRALCRFHIVVSKFPFFFFFLMNPYKKSTTNGLFLQHHLQRLKLVLSEARNMEIDIDFMNTIFHWLQWLQL